MTWHEKEKPFSNSHVLRMIGDLPFAHRAIISSPPLRIIFIPSLSLQGQHYFQGNLRVFKWTCSNMTNTCLNMNWHEILVGMTKFVFGFSEEVSGRSFWTLLGNSGFHMIFAGSLSDSFTLNTSRCLEIHVHKIWQWLYVCRCNDVSLYFRKK